MILVFSKSKAKIKRIKFRKVNCSIDTLLHKYNHYIIFINLLLVIEYSYMKKF